MSPPGVLRSPDDLRVRLDLIAYCRDCHIEHRLGRTPADFTVEMWQWEAKHRGHDFEFLSPRRHIPPRFDDRVYQRAGEAPWWLRLWEKACIKICTTAANALGGFPRANADVKPAYAASAAITLGLQVTPLASSATFVAGRESTSIVNTSNLYIDEQITAKITTGTSPTVDTEIRLYAYSVLNDTPLYPDTITGTDANVTLTNAYILDAGIVKIGWTAISATSSIGYYLQCFTLAQVFNRVPTRWGLYCTHNTGVALHATAGNHVISHIGAYFTVI